MPAAPDIKAFFDEPTNTVSYLVSDPVTRQAAVIDPVWDLLDQAYSIVGVHPTLLERDFNIPALAELTSEVRRIADLQAAHAPGRRSRHG